MKDEFGKYYEAKEPGRRERAYAWATAIGLQDVDGLKPSKYLIKTAKRNIEGEITAAEARKLVDEYYETKINHDVPADAEEADKVAARIVSIVNSPGFRLSPEYYIGLHRQIFDGVFPHAGEVIGADYGSSVAKATTGLHRKNVVINVVKDVVKENPMSEAEEMTVKALLRCPKTTAAELAKLLKVTPRQAQRVVASLKVKAGLKRRGGRKNGEWYFEKEEER